ncbi:MAG TPA: amidohydrolase family protein [Bryobacteraceae bacterium]|nr:amidohydrolase family protein [Bryobacteraceae bacterium]
MKRETRQPLVVDALAFAGAGRTWASPEREVDYNVDLLLERGAAAGIDRHCVMPPRNDTYAEANRAVARLCEKHAGKLIGFAAHSPQREAGQLRQALVDELKGMGLKAVRSDGHPTRELMDAAQEFRIPVVYYPGPARWQQLGRYYHMLATAYPAVNLIIPHLGQYASLSWPAHIEAIDLAKRYRNVYLDLSGIGSFKYAELAAADLPAEKLLFGTGAPELDPRVGKEALRLLKLAPEAYAKVAGGNILRLLGGR